MPEIPRRGSIPRTSAGTPSESRYFAPSGSLNRRSTLMQSSSSTAATASVAITLWTQGTCLSPIPSIRCAPNPFMKSVGHWRASLATVLHPGNFDFR